jgi:YggT family protein
MGTFIYMILWGLLEVAKWLIIVSAVLSWLVAFDVVNIRNERIRQIVYGLDRVTAPLLAPFRRFIPPLGGMDITPIIALIVLHAAQAALLPWVFAPIRAAIG